MSDTAGAAAPQSAPESSGAQEGQTSAPVVDFGEILAKHQSELARTGQTVENLRGELAKRDTQFERVRQAFSGDEKKASPHEMRLKQFDDLEAYLDEQAKEHGLPITTKIGKQFASYAKEAEKANAELRAELETLKDDMKRQKNPAWQGLERAAFIMEGMVDEALTQMYGADAGSKQIRAAQFNAVTARVNAEIKDLIDNEPDTLMRIQRNPKLMRNMVNHFMAEMLPPKVRNMLEDEKVKNTPMQSSDLAQAFRQAQEQFESASSKGDQKKAQYFSNLMTDIRRDLLAEQWSGQRASSDGRPSINQLFRNSVGGG